MKYLNILFAALFIFSVYSCSKPETNTPTVNTNPNNPNNNIQTFEVTGLNGITLKHSEETYLTLSIQHKSGEQGQVSLSVKDLPANVTASFSAQTGTPTFATVCTLKSNGASNGDYTPALVVTPKSGTEKSYSFNLKVDEPAPSDCREWMVGSYKGTADCAAGTEFQVKLHPVSDRVIFSVGNTSLGTAPPGFSLEANVFCSTNTFEIPPTSVGGPNMFYAAGKILGPKKISLTFDVSGGGSCTHIFTGN